MIELNFAETPTPLANSGFFKDLTHTPLTRTVL